MLIFSSFFGVSFVIMPQHLLSTFWNREGELAVGDVAPQFFGFDLIKLSDIEYWWIRCIGLTILGLNIAFGVRGNIDQPLYTTGSLTVVLLLNLFNLHQVQ